MEQASFILALIFLVEFLSVVSASTLQQQCDDSGGPAGVRAGYWSPSSSRYYPVSSIDASLYTHLYYSSLSIDETSSAVTPPPADESSLLAAFSSTVKSGSPSVKTILCIGTDRYKVDVSNAAFSRMASDKNLRRVFINSSVEVARANGFDGLDLSWIFPATQMDMENLGVLLAEWRARIVEESTTNSLSEPLLLTATLYFSSHLFGMPDSNLDYPIDDISSNLDWANLLTFGFHGNSNITTADAPLYDKSSHFSVSYGVISWLDAGAPPCKLVMGIPLFGRSWFLRNKAKNGLGSPTAAAGTKQRKSNQTGIIAYAEIEEYLNSDSTIVTYDNQSVVEYFYNGDLWVSFDSAQAVQKKLEFAARSRLLGFFLWTISFDDSNSTISKQASESWHQYAQGGFGIMRSGGPNQHVAFNSSSVSLGSWYSKTLSYLFSSVLLLMILFR
ncbi:nod factor hydrolase protein 1-like [Phragmites australis]|uniref:nod factor hydrolase protein 1-like n=1 Tax=Phragmites australis TaxID=29695 RepID=UPI002D767060|nr:nod factor hydrolase protein 1-like [Phragmites australis]